MFKCGVYIHYTCYTHESETVCCVYILRVCSKFSGAKRAARLLQKKRPSRADAATSSTALLVGVGVALVWFFGVTRSNAPARIFTAVIFTT